MNLLWLNVLVFVVVRGIIEDCRPVMFRANVQGSFVPPTWQNALTTLSSGWLTAGVLADCTGTSSSIIEYKHSSLTCQKKKTEI